MTAHRSKLTRRALLAGLLASAAGPSWAAPPTVSLRPFARPDGWHQKTIRSAPDILSAARVSGKTAYVVADLETGEILEAGSPLLALPPASVTKTVTTLYALDILGPGFRFPTRLVATGPLVEGRLQGDLILAGGGDPVLDTDALAEMARALKSTGLRSMTGKLRPHDGALPAIRTIDPLQPEHVGYSPSISGLNLNFNRVYFEWKRGDEDYTVSMDARSERYRPRVSVSRMQLADRDLPVYTYGDQGGHDNWTVARSALGQAGGRWLPVRYPARYAAEVFQDLARAEGIELRLGEAVTGPVGGTTLVSRDSDPLDAILRGMLRYSTNLTAETIGLTATGHDGTRVAGLEESAARMSRWLHERLGTSRPKLVDHSGLGDGSRLSTLDMVRILSLPEARGGLRDLLKGVSLRDETGAPMKSSPVQVSAKTGTLNFVSTLAGYLTTPGGRDLAFAIFSADLPWRDSLGPEERERPDGGRAWSLRARALQNDLLLRWSEAYDR